MKMQEVIVRLRGLAPAVAEETAVALSALQEARAALMDLTVVKSMDAKEVLAALASQKVHGAHTAMGNCAAYAEKLQKLNESYREKLGPRSKKPKDDPRQMDLFDGSCSTTGVHDPDTEARQ